MMERRSRRAENRSRVSFKEGESAAQTWQENREKAHQCKKARTDGTGSLQGKAGMEAVNARTAKPGICSSSQHKKLRTNIKCVAFPNTFSRS